MKDHPRILAIDDEQMVLTLVKRTLASEGFEVITSSDGSSVQNLIEEHNPALVLLDIRMPGLDGFQVLELIRQRSNVPVIMLSADREVETKRDTLMLGADDYVAKPFRSGELVARIKAKLRRSG